MLTGARRVLGVAGGRVLSPGGLHMRIWLWHCTSVWSAGGGQLGTEAGGTEVALEERPGAPHAAGVWRRRLLAAHRWPAEPEVLRVASETLKRAQPWECCEVGDQSIVSAGF